MSRQRIRSSLSAAAAAMPAAQRRAFRAYLADLDGKPAKRRKVHSWHRARPKAKPAPAPRQPELPL